MLQISSDPQDSAGDSRPLSSHSGASDPVMAALVDIWEAPLGIRCPIGPGVPGLTQALIGKTAEWREDGGQVPAGGTRRFWLVVNQLGLGLTASTDKLADKRAF